MQRNWQQEAKLLEFMRQNVDLARNFTKKNPIASAALWDKLTFDLNNLGPPIKSVGRWKKAWMDWKSSVKKKLSHNRTEMSATGGGIYNQYVLSANENEVAQISGIFKCVDDVTNDTFGVRQNALETITKPKSPIDPLKNSDEISFNTTTQNTTLGTITENIETDEENNWNTGNLEKKETEISTSVSQTKKKYSGPQKNVENLMESEIDAFNNIGSKIDTTNKILQNIYNLINVANDENRRHNQQMESTALERNELLLMAMEKDKGDIFAKND